MMHPLYNKVTGLFTVMIVSMIALVALSACGKGTPEPNLSITIGDQSIKPIYYGDLYNESREDIERFLDFPFENASWEELPYVALGDEVVIEATNFDTELFTVEDAILKQDGTFKYNEKSTNVYDVEVVDGIAKFDIPGHAAAHLSSNSEDYKPGHTIRAFVLRAKIDKADFAFAFVIRTNAD
jgi:hypothetical protein